MMNLMRLFVALLAVALGARADDIGAVKTIYLLPMSSAFEQFLAMHLTSDSVQVVTDPNKADAILCDRLGPTFEEKMDALYKKGAVPEHGPLDDPDHPVSQPVSHARGTIFLVDRKTRNVLWSAYERPKSTSQDDLNRAAEKIASKLSKDLRTEPKGK